MTRIVFAAALALAIMLPAVSAQAQAPRTFVSAAGTDNPSCSFAAPCRHFQAALNVTSPGGEIDALDPAGYSPINIDRAITIEGQGWSYIAPPPAGNAITVNIPGGTGNVTIHGVSHNGAGVTGTTNGIVFNSGASLTVTDCVAQNFSDANGNGILIQPSSGAVSFVITNTTVSNNGNGGIVYLPPSGSATAIGAIDHVVASNNQFGISINTSDGGGATTVAISDSIASKNSQSGIFVENGAAAAAAPLAVSIDGAGINGNLAGITAYFTSNILLGRSVITANTLVGISNNTNPNTFFSYKDNRINLNNNGSNIGGSLLVGVLLQ